MTAKLRTTMAATAALLAASGPAATQAEFAPVRVVESGSVTVAAPLDEAFELFTPLGEARWVEGWRPRVLSPAELGLAASQVFATSAKGRQTVWMIVDYDRPACRIRYARLTPGWHVGTVDVACQAAGDGGTGVRVTYDLTAVSAAGADDLRAFADGYRQMMADWQAALDHYVTTGQPVHQPH